MNEAHSMMKSKLKVRGVKNGSCTSFKVELKYGLKKMKRRAQPSMLAGGERAGVKIVGHAILGEKYPIEGSALSHHFGHS